MGLAFTLVSVRGQQQFHPAEHEAEERRHTHAGLDQQQEDSEEGSAEL